MAKFDGQFGRASQAYAGTEHCAMRGRAYRKFERYFPAQSVEHDQSHAALANNGGDHRSAGRDRFCRVRAAAPPRQSVPAADAAVTATADDASADGSRSAAKHDCDLCRLGRAMSDASRPARGKNLRYGAGDPVAGKERAVLAGRRLAASEGPTDQVRRSAPGERVLRGQCSRSNQRYRPRRSGAVRALPAWRLLCRFRS